MSNPENHPFEPHGSPGQGHLCKVCSFPRSSHTTYTIPRWRAEVIEVKLDHYRQALEKVETLVMEYLTGQFLDPVAVCISVRDTARHALNKEKEDNGR